MKGMKAMVDEKDVMDALKSLDAKVDLVGSKMEATQKEVESWVEKYVEMKRVAEGYAEAAEDLRKMYHREHSFTLACCRKSVSVRLLTELEKGDVTRARIKELLAKEIDDEKNAVEENFDLKDKLDDNDAIFGAVLAEVAKILSTTAGTWGTWQKIRRAIRRHARKVRNIILHGIEAAEDGKSGKDNVQEIFDAMDEWDRVAEDDAKRRKDEAGDPSPGE